MQIDYVTGDLLKADQIVVVHGCNARGAFGSGVAGAIRRTWPWACDAYLDAFRDHFRPLTLGEVIWAIDTGPGRPSRIVGNLITQQDYGRDPNRRYVDYEAVRAAMHKVNEFVQHINYGDIELPDVTAVHEVAMPLIGCGLGGGEWPVVADIIASEARHFTPVVYTRDGIVPGVSRSS
jgi:O-acetyl-ADP-ribose deacetylase (regulator of RNase III)